LVLGLAPSCSTMSSFWSDVFASAFGSNLVSGFGSALGSARTSIFASTATAAGDTATSTAGVEAPALATALLASASALLRRSSSANPGNLSLGYGGGLVFRPCFFDPPRFASSLECASLLQLAFRPFLRSPFLRSWPGFRCLLSAGFFSAVLSVEGGRLGGAFAVVA